MTARRDVLALAGLTLTLGACDGKSLPTAPSGLESGVSIYEDANYLGASAHITSDVKDLEDFDGPCKHEFSTGSNGLTTTVTYHDWNDCVSSLRVAAGWRVIVFRDDDFSGQRLELTEDVSNFQLVAGSCDHDGLNDCITSIKVFAP